MRWILPLFNKRARERVEFELDQSEMLYASFASDGIVADWAFECSSEGEFEQIRPLVGYFLEKNQKVELIYCSESVDHRCVELALNYPELLRIYRLPILTFFPGRRDASRWLTSKRFVLCRYDFFPELIFYGSKKDVDFMLVWATLKSNPKGIGGVLYSLVYRSFNRIVTATQKDRMLIQTRYGFNEKQVVAHDFRPVQIANRLANASDKLAYKFPNFQDFQKILEHFPEEKRMIFGSFWEVELQAFEHGMVEGMLKDHCLITIVPHSLDEKEMQAIRDGLKQRGLLFYEITAGTTHFEMLELVDSLIRRPGILLLTLKGILCELYPYFTYSFVGGGHGLSIHSVLEPYVAGTRIFCGPRIHRSTEYDLIVQKAPNKISIVENLGQLFPLIDEHLRLEYRKGPVNLEETIATNNQVINWLESPC